jgi:drug/metabolite transporter (DMT)-like permease
MKKEKIGYLEIIGSAVLGSFIPILVRFGKDIGANNLVFFRILFAVIILGAWFFIFRKKLVPFKYNIWLMILFGALHSFVLLSHFAAVNLLSVANAVLLLHTFPIWMVIFSYFIFKEKINKKTIFALVVSFTGVIILLYPEKIIGNNLFGYILGIFSGFGAGLVYVLSKKLKKYDSVSLTFWQNLIAIPFALPLIFLELVKFSYYNLFIILLISFCGVGLFVLLFNGLKKVKASIGGIVLLLEVIIPVIFALFFFKEIPSLYSVIGGVLILIGVYIACK